MNNKYIEEDFERMKELDGVWSIEAQREVEEEYWEWLEEEERKNRLPAIIYVEKPNKEKDDSIQVIQKNER